MPARLDRLPFSQWHWLVIAALGITWILDGLEVTMVGNVAAVLTDPNSELGLSGGQVSLAGGIYIAGACTGALFFSYLTDRFGRKKLFMITLGLYLVFTVLTAFSWNFWSFVLFRFFTVAGAATVALAGRKSRLAAVAGGAMILAGSALERWSVFGAGFQSARDPKYSVIPQRERLDSRGEA